MNATLGYPNGPGYTCVRCNGFVPNGCVHHCPTTAIHPPYPRPTFPPAIRFNESGWLCPSCGAGVAPFMPFCPHCAPKKDAPARAGGDTNND